jgi:hypothetical protein
MAATDSPDSTTGTREAERSQATTGDRFTRPGEVSATPADTSSGDSIAAIVLGALGIVVGGLLIPLVGLVLGLVGLMLGVGARLNNGGGSMVGIILSAIAIVLSLGNLIATAVSAAS